MTDPVEILLERARAARAADRLSDAREAYVEAAERAEAEGAFAPLAHACRHLSDLDREAGAAEQALDFADRAITLYRLTAPRGLDLANAVRLRALALEAMGQDGSARQAWAEARDLYEAQGVAAGASECRLHLDCPPGLDGNATRT